ncbi:MAG: hypothetical protein JWM09_485 [Francisellaceae bacterium]|nr:hypothetical protein [Francisellaceae bacterium]
MHSKIKNNSSKKPQNKNKNISSSRPPLASPSKSNASQKTKKIGKTKNERKINTEIAPLEGGGGDGGSLQTAQDTEENLETPNKFISSTANAMLKKVNRYHYRFSIPSSSEVVTDKNITVHVSPHRDANLLSPSHISHISHLENYNTPIKNSKWTVAPVDKEKNIKFLKNFSLNDLATPESIQNIENSNNLYQITSPLNHLLKNEQFPSKVKEIDEYLEKQINRLSNIEKLADIWKTFCLVDDLDWYEKLKKVIEEMKCLYIDFTDEFQTNCSQPSSLTTPDSIVQKKLDLNSVRNNNDLEFTKKKQIIMTKFAMFEINFKEVMKSFEADKGIYLEKRIKKLIVLGLKKSFSKIYTMHECIADKWQTEITSLFSNTNDESQQDPDPLKEIKNFYDSKGLSWKKKYTQAKSQLKEMEQIVSRASEIMIKNDELLKAEIKELNNQINDLKKQVTNLNEVGEIEKKDNHEKNILYNYQSKTQKINTEIKSLKNECIDLKGCVEQTSNKNEFNV